MRKVSYTFMIPDDADVESITLHFEHKTKANEPSGNRQNSRIVTFHHPRYDEYQEPDEEFLYDELY